MKIQKFMITIGCSERDDCGNPIPPKTEGEIRRILQNGIDASSITVNEIKKETKVAKNKKNPLVGKEVWTLVITNDYGIGETTSAVFTSFQKALNAAKVEFREHNLMEYWEGARRSLKYNWFFRDSTLFNGDRFLIECVKIN